MLAIVPTVVLEVVDRDASLNVLVAAIASGSDGFMSMAYMRRTSRLSTSSDNGTCSSTIVPGTASDVLPEIVIIALVTVIPLVMSPCTQSRCINVTASAKPLSFERSDLGK